MSNTLIRRLLWLALVVALPVPYWLFEPGRVPTLFLGELSAFVLAMLVREGGMVTSVVATLFVTQTLLFLALTWVVARVVTRLIARVEPDGTRTATALVTIVLLLCASLLPLYRSPLVGGGEPVNLVALFQ